MKNLSHLIVALFTSHNMVIFTLLRALSSLGRWDILDVFLFNSLNKDDLTIRTKSWNKKLITLVKQNAAKREVRKKSLVLIYYHLWRLTVRVTKTFTAARLLLGERVSWHFWMNSHINNGSVVKHKYTSAKKSGWQKKKELIDVSRNRGDNSKKISNTLVPTCCALAWGY